jgi:hypothetical protein
VEGIPADNTGWYHPCNLGIPNDGLKDVKSCKKYSPNKGFKIGGYYSHVHFEYDKKTKNPCMEMIVHSDGQFPTDDRSEMIQFHICDFRQLEDFVKEWGSYFRRLGIIDYDE